MSIINNMLKDLEKRNALASNQPQISLMYAQDKSDFFENKKKYIILSIFLIFLISIISFLLLTKTKNLSVDFPPDTSIVSRLNELMDNEWQKPVDITGITVQTKDNITEISLMLDHKAFYRLLSNQLYNQFSIIIDQASLVAELPTSTSLGGSVLKLTSEKLKDATRFNFILDANSTIKYVDLISEKSSPELVIAIEANKINSKVVNTPHRIKLPALQTVLLEQYKSALTMAESGNISSSIEKLKTIIRMNPDFKDARVSLAALLIDQGQKPQAENFLNEGLKRHGTYIPYIELKARLLLLSGKAKNALDLLQSISPSIDEYPEYYASIAAVYEKLNYDQLSSQLYKKLLALNIRNSNWWFGLGVSLDKLGQQTQASDAFKRALAEGELSPEALKYIHHRLNNLQDTRDAKA